MRWALLLLPFCCATASALEPVLSPDKTHTKATYDYYSTKEVVVDPNSQCVTWDGKGTHSQYLDLYLPVGRTQDFPIIVFVHGGGWLYDSRLNTDPKYKVQGVGVYQNVGKTWASHGVAVAVIDYQMGHYTGTVGGKDFKVTQRPYPQDVEDVAQAIRWVRGMTKKITHPKGSEKDGHVRTDCIFLAGHSAGGHLVSLVTTDPNYLQGGKGTAAITLLGVIALSGVYDVSSPSTYRTSIFGSDLNGASPIWWAAQKGEPVLPPFQLFYGSPSTTDGDLPHEKEHSTAFYNALLQSKQGLYPPIGKTQLDHMGVMMDFNNDADAKKASIFFISHKFVIDQYKIKNP